MSWEGITAALRRLYWLLGVTGNVNEDRLVEVLAGRGGSNHPGIALGVKYTHTHSELSLAPLVVIVK